MRARPNYRTHCWLLIGLSVAITQATSNAEAESLNVESLSAPTGFIYVVGHSGSTVDPVGEFTICRRGISGCLPSPNMPCTIDFTNCPDIRIATLQLYPGVSSPACRKVQAFTGPDGVARFRIIGNAVNTGSCTPGGGFATITLLDLVTTVKVAAFDQDGGGVGGNDLSLWLSDYSCGQYFPRSDYDGNGTIGGNDLSLWLTVDGAGGSVQGAPAPFGVCKPGDGSTAVVPVSWGQTKWLYR